MAKFGFSPAEVDVNAQATYDPLPRGDYKMKCLDAELKDTKAGGQYIEAKFEVVGGEYDGRFVWNNFNIVNASEKAQNIGRQQLVSWATACGKPDAEDTDKLIDRPFMCSLTIEKGTGTYADSNRISAFLFDKGEASPGKPVASKPAASKPAASASKGANPWD